jgi:sodium-dependent dicarboxylate transporter 2/3/5
MFNPETVSNSNQSKTIMHISKQNLGLVLGPGLFCVTFFFTSPEGMSDAARGVLASTLWIATWWITEAIPIPVTALLPVILFPLTGGLAIGHTTGAYGDPIIFLFIGAFIIAVAIERWNLHKRIALNIIKAMGTQASRIILGFMIATALLSMWISNTATTLMMMPMGMAIIAQLTDLIREQAGGRDEAEKFGKALMLSIAYAASIGGLATLIGTPTNVVFSGIVKQMYNQEISFARWLMVGLPFSIVLLGICWVYLVRFAFSFKSRSIPGGQAVVKKQLAALGKITPEEKRVLIVFIIIAVAWITRSFLLNKFIAGINDTVIAISGAMVLFLIPAKSNRGAKLLDWETALKLPWGIVLLFGGGLSLAAGFRDSGLAEWLGNRMALLGGIPYILILVFVIASVNFLTEMTSNVATASMLLPILAGMSLAIDVHPFGLMLSASIAATCAFMLPVATPPNAVVFGSGHLRMQDMVRAGFAMNIISIILLTIYVYLLLPLLWGIDLRGFPEMMR